MSVDTIKPQGGGGNPLNGTYFADNFQRADQPFFFGDKWYQVITGNASSGYTGANLEAFINVGGAPGQLNLTTTFGGGRPGILGIPIPLDYYKISTHSQFAEAKLVADNSAGANFANNGPFVASQPNGDGAGGTPGYYLVTFMQSGVWAVYNGSNSGGATLILNPGAGSLAIGDTVRVEVDFGASSNAIRGYKNGTLLASATDNSAGRVRFGMPGFCFPFTSAGITQSWQNFKCGVLPQKSTLANWP